MPTATKEATAVLSAHSGATIVSRQDLALIKVPERTTTFRPVPHSHMVDLIQMGLTEYGMEVVKEQYAVQNDGMRLFGTLVLKHQLQPDFNFAIGLRTSNDKTIAAQLTAGLHVFVCDNMAMSGDIITWRKHTGSLDIRMELFEGIGRAIGMFQKLDHRVAALKETGISDDQAKAMILDAALRHEVMPTKLLADVYKAYFEPPHAEFEPRNMWSLHNSFTEVFKGLRANLAMESNIRLGKLFAL